MINWSDDESYLFLNPKLSNDEISELTELFKKYYLPAHIWVTSSGSAKKESESLKLIALSKKAFLVSALSVNEHLQSTAKDVWLHILPEFHVGGLAIHARSYFSKARVVKPSNFIWSAKNFFHQLIQSKATLCSLVPTQVYDLVESNLQAPAELRAIIVGGGGISAELLQKAEKLKWPLVPSFGMTEFCSQIATAKLGHHQLSILPHVECRVDAEGLLQVKSEAMLTGYAQVIKGQAMWTAYEPGSWYQSEDMVKIENNFLTPLGRKGQFVKILGEGVSILKLQTLLEALLPNSVVVTEPDERRGYNLILISEKTNSISQVEQVFNSFNSNVMPFERLNEFRIVDQLSRTWKGFKL